MTGPLTRTIPRKRGGLLQRVRQIRMFRGLSVW